MTAAGQTGSVAQWTGGPIRAVSRRSDGQTLGMSTADMTLEISNVSLTQVIG